MARGFTDSKGNFRPTGNSIRSSSKERSIQPNGRKLSRGEEVLAEIIRRQGIEDEERIGIERIVAGKIALNGDDYELGIIEQEEPKPNRYVLKKTGIVDFESSDFNRVEMKYDDILTQGDVSEMENLLNEYTHSTLTEIRQADAINFLNENGVRLGNAIDFIRIELKDAPLARIGNGFGDGT